VAQLLELGGRFWVSVEQANRRRLKARPDPVILHDPVILQDRNSESCAAINSLGKIIYRFPSAAG